MAIAVSSVYRQGRDGTARWEMSDFASSGGMKKRSPKASPQLNPWSDWIARVSCGLALEDRASMRLNLTSASCSSQVQSWPVSGVELRSTDSRGGCPHMYH